MTDQQLKDAWKALDHLVGKLCLHEYDGLRACVQACQDAKDQEDEIEADNIDQSNKPEEP